MLEVAPAYLSDTDAADAFLQKFNDQIGLSYERGVTRLPLAHEGAARGHLPLQDRVDGPILRADDVGGESVFPAVLWDASPAAGGLRTQQASRPGGERFGTVAVEECRQPGRDAGWSSRRGQG